jgi:lysylphosphatidylglycerol synthetase-like protein (DUF2156 family)
MKNIKKILLLTGLIASFGLTTIPAQVGAVNAFGVCTSSSESDVCGAQSDNVNHYIGIIVNTLLFVVGAVSVVVIIYAGIRYVTSAGDSSRVAGAKNTLLYAVVGLVVAVLAYAIVNFVLHVFSK